MRFSLRTLLIVLAVLPVLIGGVVWTLWPERGTHQEGQEVKQALGITMNLDALPWTVIETSNDDGPSLVRRRDFPATFPRRVFPHRLNIFWQMSETSANGMPEDGESARLVLFEDRLVEATEVDQQSVLSLVLTGNGQREYVFHTRNPNEFVRRLTDMPQEPEPYPIEIHHTKDDMWEYVDRVLGDFVFE